MGHARIMRVIWLGLGLVFTAIALVGAALPVLPTTPFLIVAATCFAKSSPRLEAWLLAHPSFGPLLADWRAHSVIPPRAKGFACAGMTLGYILFWLGARPGWLLASAVAVLMLASASYVLSRPSRPPRHPK